MDGWAGRFTHIAKYFAENGFIAVAFDFHGFGKSDVILIIFYQNLFLKKFNIINKGLKGYIESH